MTPQQANELLRNALAHAESVYRLNVVKDGEPSSTLENMQRVLAMTADLAPAPTSEPGARDAVLEEAALACENERVEEIDEADKSYNWAIKHSADAIRHLKRATPASPAVPMVRLHRSKGNDVRFYLTDAGERANLPDNTPLYADPAPLVAQASPELPAVLFDAMAVYEETARWRPHAKISANNVSDVLDAVVRLIKSAPEASPLVEDAQRIVAGKVEDTKHIPPFAEPASQQVIVEAAAFEAGIQGEWDPFSDAFRVFIKGNMFLGAIWTPTPEELEAGRFRAQGGNTNDSTSDHATTGNATADDGKDK